MFRALCAHHQEVIIVLYSIWYRHTETSEWSNLILNHSIVSVWWYQMPYITILTSRWWAQKYSKHVEACNKFIIKQDLCIKLVNYQDYTETHGQQNIEEMCVLIFSINFVWISLIVRRTQPNMITNAHWSSCQIPVMLIRFSWKLNLHQTYSWYTQVYNFMKIQPVGTELFPVHSRNMTQILVAFRRFSKAPKKWQELSTVAHIKQIEDQSGWCWKRTKFIWSQ